MKLYRIVASVILTIGLLLVYTTPAQAARGKQRDDYERQIKSVADYFESVMNDPMTAIPPSYMKRAVGLVILRQYKAGFLFGVKGGGGVAIVRNQETGEWSPPAFLNAGEGSWGLQLGAQQIDTIFLIMNEEGMKLLTSPNFRMGVDVRATAGPTGGGAEAKVGQTPVLVYSKNKGLFAGAALEGGFLLPDDKANAVFYENASYTMKEILFDNVVDFPEEVLPLVELIEIYSITPDEVEFSDSADDEDEKDDGKTDYNDAMEYDAYIGG